MSLSDTLIETYKLLRADLKMVREAGNDDLLDEVSHILSRMETLHGKLTASMYEGTMRYEDNGVYDGYVEAVRRYKSVKENLIKENKKHLIGHAYNDFIKAYWKNLKSKS